MGEKKKYFARKTSWYTAVQYKICCFCLFVFPQSGKPLKLYPANNAIHETHYQPSAHTTKNNFAFYLLVIWVGSCRPGSSSKISLSSSLRSVTSASCSMIRNASAMLRNVEKSRSLFGVVTRTVSVMKTLEVLSSFWTSTQGMISFTAIAGRPKVC